MVQGLKVLKLAEYLKKGAPKQLGYLSMTHMPRPNKCSLSVRPSTGCELKPVEEIPIRLRELAGLSRVSS